MPAPQANTVTVTILDKSYQVACPPGQQADLLSSASYLDAQMRAIRDTGKVVGLERIAVMAALNISHELLHATRDSDPAGAASERNDEAVRQLNDKLEAALHKLRQIEIG